MKQLLFFFILLWATICLAQKHDYIWLLGGDGCTNFNPPSWNSTIDFNQSPAELNLVCRPMKLSSCQTHISDEEGNLLYYSNGCYIRSANGEVMENGDSINPGNTYEDYCNDNYPGLVQSMLSLPMNANEYFIIHKTSRVVQNTPLDLDILTDNLFYTRVDMSYNDGKGKAIEKNVPIFSYDSLISCELAAVRHSNGQDWWVINPHKMLGRFFTFLLTTNGVVDTIDQIIGNSVLDPYEGGGQTVFSPDGTKYIRYTPIEDIDIFDFDRATGLLSNYLHIPLQEHTYMGVEPSVGGVAVSPNNRYMYITSKFAVYQYDLEAADIAGSQVLLDTFDGFVDPDFPAGVSFYAAQLGPDCRIYINSPNDVSYLHVIKYPDRAGLACELVQHGLELPSGHNFSMPYFPNYRLGTEYVYPCDSTINLPLTSATQPIVRLDERLILSPNPCHEVLRIALPVGIDERDAVVKMTNMLGQTFEVSAVSEGMGALLADVSGLPSGLYFCSVSVGNKKWTQKVVVAR